MDPLYEQLKRRIEGNRHAVGRAGDIFMSMVSRDALRRQRNNEDRQLDADDLEQLFTSQGVFFRQVTLDGQWWKHTTGRLLAFLKEDDTPVILVPGFASYSFLHPLTGHRYQVNQRTTGNQLLKPEAFCLTMPLPTGPLSLRDLGRFAWRSLSNTDLCYICLACVSVVLLTMFTKRGYTQMPAGWGRAGLSLMKAMMRSINFSSGDFIRMSSTISSSWSLRPNFSFSIS